jgi:hypothetical protein
MTAVYALLTVVIKVGKINNALVYCSRKKRLWGTQFLFNCYLDIYRKVITTLNMWVVKYKLCANYHAFMLHGSNYDILGNEITNGKIVKILPI